MANEGNDPRKPLYVTTVAGPGGDPAEDQLGEIRDLLQQIEDNTDGLELKADTVNLNTDQLEGYLDGVETLLNAIEQDAATDASVLLVRDAVNALGVHLDGVETLLATIRDNSDTVEALLAALGNNTDGLETKLDTIHADLDVVEASLANIDADTTTIVNRLPQTDMDTSAGTANRNAVGLLKAGVGGPSLVNPATEDKQDTIITHLDGVESLLTTIRDNADTVETLLGARATEATQLSVLAAVDGIEGQLATLTGKDYATQTTLAAVLAAVDGIETKLDAANASLDSLEAEDFATETSLAALLGRLPATAALADDTANPTLSKIAAYPHWFDGATWDRARGDAGNGLDVDVTRSALPSGASTAANQSTIIGHLDGVETLLTTIRDNADALEALIGNANNAFATLSKAIPDATTKELRYDDISGGDLYIGRAPDGTATSAASWEVVQYTRTATGAITRQRYRTGVAWDSRTVGWS